jgi:SpoIID/LytB domain protein
MRSRPSAVARPAAALLAALGTLVAGATLAPANAVSTDQTYWMPVSRTVTVTGHGYGHGHGMSQYGAEGAALRGLKYRDIVDFYYPGTSWSKVTGKIRVLISADTTSDVVVSPADGLTVRDLGDGSTYPLPEIAGLRRWRITVDDRHRSVLGYQTKTWHRWHPGGRDALAGDGEFFAAGPLTLWTPSGARTYRGILRSASPTKGSADRATVNVLSMDQYVQGVVPYEMPASWRTEAVKAQAVAARTYAAWSRAQAPNRYYQICDSAYCQVYGGASGEDSRSNAAVRDTARQILTYGGRPAFTQFSSSSGGWTSAGSMPYLTAKADPYDGFSGNPMHSWSATVDVSRLERSYPSLGTLQDIRVVSRDGHGDWRGRVGSMVLDGTDHDVTISGDTFRSLFGLRSSWFSIEPTPIIARWSDLGGKSSVLGAVEGGESAVADGAQQRFAAGRIYYSRSTGAHELYGAILRSYRALSGPTSRLGFPTTGVQPRGTGYRAKFQGGAIWSNTATGTVPVLGPIATSYRKAGGVGSDLGWPTSTNKTTSTGERVGFEHGYGTWVKKTGKVTLTVTG